MNASFQARFEQLKSSGLLPSPKGPALAVVKLTRDENVSLAQLALAIKADPSLMARLVKLANSCRAPGVRPVLAIQDAVSVLGLTAVRGLALGFSLINEARSGKCRAFDYPAFWSRNLARAVAMQALAPFARVMPGDEAFTLGLLAHTGELGLASVFPDDYASLLERLPARGAGLLQEERQSFSLDHADLTAALLSDWGLPVALIEPVRCHEQPQVASFAAGSRPDRLLQVLMLASRIADICLAPAEQRHAMFSDLFALGENLSIGADMLTELCDGVVRGWGEWCSILDVPPQPLPPFAELMRAPLPDAPGAIVDAGGGAEPETPGTAPHETYRVLVVDDDRVMRNLLKALLVHVGHEFLEAENGRRGLEIALAKQPHLMIVDWRMPEMNGIELIRALRKTGFGRGVYILILTGLDQEEVLIEALDAGADDFLTKPLKAKVLAAKIRAGLRVVALRREIERDQSNLNRFASEFAALNKRLQETRQADPLTGLAARGATLEWLRQMWPAAVADPTTTLAALVVRPDQLDNINLVIGRLAGDEVLQRAAAVLRAGLRPEDKIARYSGSEFIVLFAKTPTANNGFAVLEANRLLREIAATGFETGDRTLRLTMSGGLAFGRQWMKTSDDLLNGAEAALAEARRAGGNRVVTGKEKEE
ncbi:MAG: HDOD domain-containing protein [Betaproteobacteria bacterium]|nr:HDOD domain-containing protein [Betaproteobacteria bacterium]